MHLHPAFQTEINKTIIVCKVVSSTWSPTEFKVVGPLDPPPNRYDATIEEN